MGKDLVAKLDIEATHPSITYELVIKAANCSAKRFSEKERARIEAGLKILMFIIFNCLINFQDKYYRYKKEEDPFTRVLSIGGYGSAWLAGLTACYILDETEPVWSAQFTLFKIYRDNGCGLCRNTTVLKMCKWFTLS